MCGQEEHGDTEEQEDAQGDGQVVGRLGILLALKHHSSELGTFTL